MGVVMFLCRLVVLVAAAGVALVANPRIATGVAKVDSLVAQMRGTEMGQKMTMSLSFFGPMYKQGYVASAPDSVNPMAGEPMDSGECTCQAGGDSVHCDAHSMPDGLLQMTGVDECCCAPDMTQQLNAVDLYPKLESLMAKPFFRFFKINLYTDCPLWPDDGQCMLETCAVEECDEMEIPLNWKLAEKGELNIDVVCTLEKGRTPGSLTDQPVDTTIDAGVKLRLSHVADWKGISNPWMVEEGAGEYIYVDLRRNPEKNTGYKGEHARKVWAAIYGQDCFQNINSPDACQENKVFYNLVSGVHTSITTHTLPAHLLKHRLGADWAKPFVDNLFFSYLFILRAVIKAGPLLEKMTYDTGNPEEDAVTQQLMRDLVTSPVLQKACPLPFDEGQMWRGQKKHERKVMQEELRLQLHNVTRAMDCVGCDKCKMWAKLRMLGVAAAFKILFSVDDCQGEGGTGELVLERNEVIALINLLAQFSSSIEAVRTMHQVPDPPPESESPQTPF